ncbi:MAG: hypothetical protein D6814_13185 [Calditrichaeota bacterium]|nr:MAG: hypothetical protein D6814_13185 [Calditrichota bacterium]
MKRSSLILLIAALMYAWPMFAQTPPILTRVVSSQPVQGTVKRPGLAINLVGQTLGEAVHDR